MDIVLSNAIWVKKYIHRHGFTRNKGHVLLNCFPFRSRQSSGFFGFAPYVAVFFEKIPLGDVESEVIMIELSESEIMDKSD